MAQRKRVAMAEAGLVKANTDEQQVNYENLGDGWQWFVNFARFYPDFLLDLLLSENADFDLTIMQRMIIRSTARNTYVNITGCRATTKTYCFILGKMVRMILYPGIFIAYYGPTLRQTAKIASKVYKESIMKNYPALAAHFNIDADSSDNFQISTATGSIMSISSFRGDTVHEVVAEEAAQEEIPRFDWEEYRRVVIPTIRGRYYVKKRIDPNYITQMQHVITSAGRRQNETFEIRENNMRLMKQGGSSFVMDIPFSVPILMQMRDTAWAESAKNTLTPDEFAREMESIYSGGDKDALIPDSTLTESRCLMLMEEHHCCKDYNNTLNPQDVFYIIGYDVSYANGANNAKCACVVVKCTKQKDWLRRDKYLKQVVWVDDWSPETPMAQAQKLKQIWYRFSIEGQNTYIAIDAWQYGTAVTQALMMDLGDGLSPLCCYNHSSFTEYELENALPIIYPIKAGGVGTTDPESEMIRNAEIQFANHNVELLSSNYVDGIEEYKRLHRIKEDRYDGLIYQAYKKTDELVGQIQNLKKVQTASGVAERRISSQIQRDSWSALKYALRFAEILERTYLVDRRKNSEWDNADKKRHLLSGGMRTGFAGTSRIPFERKGGRYHE